MATRRTTNYRTNSKKPQWLIIAGAIAALVNTLIRVFGLFRSKSKTTRSTQEPAPGEPKPRVSSSPTRETVPAQSGPVGTDGGIPALFKNKQSDRVVQASGTVVKILPDDEDTSDGSDQHQKFLVELNDRDRTTIKVAHNLKFGRVPVREGEVVAFRGEYEYTEYGGTIHWTHKDPRGTHDDGWIEYDGKQFG